MNTMPLVQCLACNGLVIKSQSSSLPPENWFLKTSWVGRGLPMRSGTYLFSRPSVLLGWMLLIEVGLGVAVACGGHRGGRGGGCLRLLRGLLLSLLHLRIGACLCCHGDQHACIGMKESM